MLSTIQLFAASVGFPTVETTAVPAPHGMSPLLHAGEDGIELLSMI